jgi:predicted transcriptional regulator
VATAKDLMTAKPSTLESSTTISDAVALFAEKKFSSVPVVSSMGEVAGQLTELVMVRALVMHQLQPEKFSKLAHCADLLAPAYFVEPGDSITTVIKAIIKSPTSRVLVRSQGAQILGIISPKDLLKMLSSGSTTEASKSIQTAMEKLTP